MLQGRGIFPCDTSVVDLHSDLDWNPDVATLGMWPLHIYEDGNVIYFRSFLFTNAKRECFNHDPPLPSPMSPTHDTSTQVQKVSSILEKLPPRPHTHTPPPRHNFMHFKTIQCVLFARFFHSGKVPSVPVFSFWHSFVMGQVSFSPIETM